MRPLLELRLPFSAEAEVAAWSGGGGLHVGLATQRGTAPLPPEAPTRQIKSPAVTAAVVLMQESAASRLGHPSIVGIHEGREHAPSN